MKYLLMCVLLLETFLLFSQENSNQISKYVVAYNYLSNDSITKEKSIEISDSTERLDILFFEEFFRENNDTYSRLLDSIRKLTYVKNKVYIDNKLKYANKPKIRVFFSKVYENTLMAEVFTSDAENVKYTDIRCWNTSYLFFFVFKGDYLEKVLRKEIAYD